MAGKSNECLSRVALGFRLFFLHQLYDYDYDSRTYPAGLEYEFEFKLKMSLISLAS